MNGHRDLIAMRRAGFKPATVYVSDYPCHTDWAKWGDTPAVCVVGDTPELEDYRFLVGTTAMVDGVDPERVRRISAACAVHATRVIATVFKKINEYRVETISIFDSEGTLTWPQ